MWLAAADVAALADEEHIRHIGRPAAGFCDECRELGVAVGPGEFLYRASGIRETVIAPPEYDPVPL